MKIFTRPAFIALVLFASFAGQTANAQLVMNPNDSVYTYNSSAAAGTVTNPSQPANGKIGKWIRTVRMAWNTNEYKAYIYEGNQYRIHFPHSYNPTANDGKKYPILVFYHGDGEVGTIYDNEDQLTHGAQIFQTMVDNGTFDGYVICMQTQYGWGYSNYPPLMNIVDSLVNYYKGDPYRVVSNGLSNGAQGVWENLVENPTYFAGAIPMSGVFTADGVSSVVNTLKFTPIWNLDGGLDNNPPPSEAQAIYADYAAAGANYVYKNYTTLGHDTWDSTWEEPNFWPFVINAYLSNPYPLYGRTTFCPGTTLSVHLGIVPGLSGYQWRLNGTVIPGATSDSIIATQPGVYDARVLRGSTWSNWSPAPVTISVQASTQSPPISVVGNMSAVLPDGAGLNSVTLGEVAGDSAYTWEAIPSNTVVGTSQTITVTQPGYYVASATPKYSCSSIFSAPFHVVNAGGPNPPSAASSLLAVALGYKSARLTWSANPNPVNPATAYEIYRGTSSGKYTYVNKAPGDSLAYTDSALSPGIVYYYAVRAIDTTAAAPLSNQVSVTTSSDNIPPTAPGALTVVSTGSTSVTLSWKAATDNVGVNHYAIYTNGVLTNVTDSLTFIVNALTNGNNYYFYVKAVDGSGNYGPQSNQVSAYASFSGLNYNYYNLSTQPGVMPDFPTLTPTFSGNMPNVSIANATATTDFAYSWNGYINIPVTGKYVFQTVSDDGSQVWLGGLNQTASPYNFSGGSTLIVNANQPQGATATNSATLTLQAGVYPISIAYFQAAGGYSMVLNWSTPQSGGSFVAIPNSAFVQSVVSKGNPPAKPTAIKATASSYKQVNLSWTDNSNNETGFEVYRSNSAAGPFQIVKTTPANTTSYSDSIGLSPSTKYYYRVQAINQYGGSGYDSASIGGISYNFYQGNFDPLPNFNTIPIVSSGSLTNISLTPAGAVTTNFGFLFSGNINIPVTGTYTFYTSSDDASELFINGYTTADMVVNNNYQQAQTQRSGTITLAKGTYPFYVAYEQTGGGFALAVSWQNTAGKIPMSAIPDSAFYNSNSAATTFALPSTPVAPYHLAASTVSSSKIALSWTDTSSSLTSYALYRSLGDTSHFNIANPNISNAATQYTDSSLFGHQTYYYRLTATGPGGTSANSAVVSAVTQDNAPVLAVIANQTIQAGTSVPVTLSATDVDGDTLTFTESGLPSFATVSQNGNGSATILFTPGQSIQGTYPITVNVSDGHGGTASRSFTATVNNQQQPPVIAQVSNYTLNAASMLSIPVVATTQSSDTLTLTITGLPDNSVIKNGANGVDTIKLDPSYGAAGNYTVIVTAKDQHNGTASDTFHITVNKVALPTTSIYVQMSDGDVAGAPWNAMTSATISSLKDNNGNTTPVGIAFQGGYWSTYNNGPVTGNNSGVYPDNVEKDYFFFGSYPGIFTGPNSVNVVVNGLDTTKLYSFTFYAGSVWSVQANNGVTTFSCQGQSGSISVQNNTQNTLTFAGLKPASNGTITFTTAVASGTAVGYFNSLVISVPFNDGTAPLSPSNLTATRISSGVQLQWYDSAYNATGYQVWRATSATGPFTQLTASITAQATSYVDSSAVSGTTYYYEVRAFNSNGTSPYSNVVTSNGSTTIARPTATVIYVQMSSGDLAGAPWNAMTSATISGLKDTTGNTTPVGIAFQGGYWETYNNGPVTGNNSGVYPDKVEEDYFFFGSYPGIFTGPNSVNVIVNGLDTSKLYSFTFYSGSVWSLQANNGVTTFSCQGQSGSINVQNNTQNTLTFSGLKPASDGTITFTTAVASGTAVGYFNSLVIATRPVTTTAPLGVANLTATLVPKGIQLNWIDSANNETGYQVWRATSAAGPFTQLTAAVPAQATSYLDSAVAPATTYYYEVRAFNSIGTSGYSNVANATTPVGNNTPPAGPAGLTVQAITGVGAQLSWTDSANNETGYQVWRATSAAGPFTLLTTAVPPKGTSYVDSTVVPETTYYYEVLAYNSYGSSGYSNVASVTALDNVPSISPIANVNVSYGMVDTVHITTTATSSDPVTLTASGLPAFATLTDNGNGTGTIVLAPPSGTLGSFNIVVSSTDQYDSVRSTSFSIQVTDPLVSTTYIHFSDGFHNGSFPWNNVVNWPSAGTGISNLVDDANNVTTAALTFTNGFSGNFIGGMQPGNHAGIYPDSVMRSGENESTNKVDSIRISGLQASQRYNFVFFNSFDYGGLGTTNFSIGTKTVTLNPDYNISNTVWINHVTADANGGVTIAVAKANTSQTFAVLNDLVIEAYDSSSSILLSPAVLRATVLSRKAVKLQWQVRSFNETAIQVLRGTDSLGSGYTVVATLPAGTSTYVDSSLKSNTDYYYVVRAEKGSTPSVNSNMVSATTYAYSIYVSYSTTVNASAPWNNIGYLPTQGLATNNFLDELGNTTNTGEVQTGLWTGIYAGGMQTGNNSGVVPDAVMASGYVLFPGVTSTITVTGLDLNLSYDFTFFASANNYYDVNTLYSINGSNALLNAEQNETGEVTIYGVTPNADGTLTMNIAPGDAGSVAGLLNSVVISGHNLSALANGPGSGNQPSVQATAQTALQGIAVAIQDSVASQPLSAYPNPFTQSFTLNVPVGPNDGKAQVVIYDVSGRTVYAQEFDNLVQGNNYLNIVANSNFAKTGVYFVKVSYSGSNTIKILKMLKL